MRPAHVFAPGKIILFGEHAVVHGQPAIAVPLSAVGVTVTAEPGAPGSGLAVRAPDLDQTLSYKATPEASPYYNALIYPLQVALSAWHLPEPDLLLTVRSTIPIASGLGSGAALATALIGALGDALERPPSNVALNPLVYEVEKRHHGTPSGIDNTVIVYEQPVYFVRGAPIETLPIGKPFCLLIGDTGRSALTRVAVGDVRKLYDSERERIQGVLDAIGSLVVDARQAIEIGDSIALGTLMVENHRLLEQLTVSSPELDRLVEIALSAGALGAKLSGGGRGGNMIALVQPDSATVISQALRQAGAQRVISTTVGS